MPKQSKKALRMAENKSANTENKEKHPNKQISKSSKQVIDKIAIPNTYDASSEGVVAQDIENENKELYQINNFLR